MTEFAKRGLIHAIINIEKSRFEILNTVYLENAWCLVYEILHQSIVIQGNSVGVLFDGLLAELPAILDSFFTSTASDYIGVVGWGWWGATKWRGKHTLCIHTCIMDPLVPELAQKVVKSVDNITTRSCETLQLGGLCLTASRDSWIQTEHSWTSGTPQKQPQEKQTGELLATIHAPMDCLIMYL